MSNHNVRKSSCGFVFWASDPLIDNFYWNLSIKGSEAQKQRLHKLLWMLWFDQKSISNLLAHSCYSEHKMWHQKQHNIKVGPFIFFSPIFFFSSSFYSYIIPPCGLISLKSTQTWFQFSIGKWLDAKKLQWKGAVFTL